MELFAKPIEDLINEFVKLPSVGPKSAQRMAFYLMGASHADLDKLISAISALKGIQRCEVCNNYTESRVCSVCSSSSRDHTLVCVVSDFRDLAAIESSGGYNGVYHVLGGLISPMDGIGPDDLDISGIIRRLPSVSELLLATNPTVNGETTALYILRQVRNVSDVTVSRIAYGVPVGSNLEYADSITISKAIEGRKKIS